VYAYVALICHHFANLSNRILYFVFQYFYIFSVIQYSKYSLGRIGFYVYTDRLFCFSFETMLLLKANAHQICFIDYASRQHSAVQHRLTATITREQTKMKHNYVDKSTTQWMSRTTLAKLVHTYFLIYSTEQYTLDIFTDWNTKFIKHCGYSNFSK